MLTSFQGGHTTTDLLRFLISCPILHVSRLYPKLVSDVLETRISPIEYHITEGKGRIKIGDLLESEMEPYREPEGKPTRFVDAIFSTIPGSVAYIGKACVHRVNIPEHNLALEYNGRNAIQGFFRFEKKLSMVEESSGTPSTQWHRQYIAL